ncbi:triosephosphate isomerase [Novosphingobium kunmingense]|uniref:Triosephosphate isomerase n=1 Tax=Novosphingobium kunmingense TaxID=1211806 RepID=A0A2N0I2W4_9SPHN|nr:triose-phosphate isomerase [Novosphingobium kunmingense]PKB25527.1 triosephosphate isomerase [Novosphingobium kunmingense]
MPQRPYIVGNWKMNGTRAQLAEARAIDRGAARHSGVRVAIAPPFTLISTMVEAVQELTVGGQDCHSQVSGAFTGDISAMMLKDAGAGFAIVGHSERRAMHGENDAMVQDKARAALDAGLEVIVCVGETEAQRDAGKAEQVVGEQVEASMPVGEGFVPRLTLAYEPVWAIGTGRVAAPADVAAMHAVLRAKLVALYGDEGSNVRILYGGSVNAGNAAELLATPEVGGALVGGASLTADSFLAIVAAAAPAAD